MPTPTPMPAPTPTREDILRGYDQAAQGNFIDRMNALSSQAVLQPVARYAALCNSDILDVGAGTGRDAAWLARRSNRVVAVEPVDRLRASAIENHQSLNIVWIKDLLPELQETLSLQKRFDLVLISAVWHHLSPAERCQALTSLRQLTGDKGHLVLSIRHGEGLSSRQGFPANVAETVHWAERSGFLMIEQIAAPSVQAGNRRGGVSWTWLVLQAR